MTIYDFWSDDDWPDYFISTTQHMLISKTKTFIEKRKGDFFDCYYDTRERFRGQLAGLKRRIIDTS
jgi:hypothetical protein